VPKNEEEINKNYGRGQTNMLLTDVYSMLVQVVATYALPLVAICKC